MFRSLQAMQRAISARSRPVELTEQWRSLISGRVYQSLAETIELVRYECVWISHRE